MADETGLLSRMLEDNVSDPTLLPRFSLFTPGFEAKPLRECLSGLVDEQQISAAEEAVARAPLPPEMSADEALSVALFAAPPPPPPAEPLSARIGRCLRERAAADVDACRGYLWHLLGACAKLPSAAEGARCRRVFASAERPSAVSYAPGRVVCWSGFATATASESALSRLLEAAAAGDRHVTDFAIQCNAAAEQNVRRLGSLAAGGEDDDELLFAPNAEFDVVSFKQTGPKSYAVELRQRPTTRPLLAAIAEQQAPEPTEVTSPAPPPDRAERMRMQPQVVYPTQGAFPVMLPSFPAQHAHLQSPAAVAVADAFLQPPPVQQAVPQAPPPQALGSHAGVRCDACGADPVVGVRYKCYSCWNFDLCETCFRAGRAAMAHTPDHAMEALLPGQRPGKTRPPAADPHGKRVVRGRDWKWSDQDGGVGGVGTVMKMVKGSPGWFRVVWDCGAKNCYRMGAEDAFDLLVVGPASAAQIVGRRVRRAQDWKWGDQDGNGLGIVISSPREGVVEVRWYANGASNHYRWGAENAFDVRVVSEPKPTAGAPPAPPPAPFSFGTAPWMSGGGSSSSSSSPEALAAFSAPEFGRWFSFGVWLIVSPREGNVFVMSRDRSILTEIVWSSNGWFRLRMGGRDWVVWSRGDKTPQNLHDTFLRPLLDSLDPSAATPIGNGARMQKERMEMVIRDGVLTATNDGDTVSFPEHSVEGAAYQGTPLGRLPTRHE